MIAQRPKSVALLVLSTVNAPYGTNLTAEELAAKICDPAAVDVPDAAVFCFLSEVGETLQRAFVEEMEIDPIAVRLVAQAFETLAGYELPLGRSSCGSGLRFPSR